jgi:maleate isomerase
VASSNSRGTVGIVRPTQRTNGYEELLQILPSGIELIPLCLDVRRGAIDEFKSAIPAYEAKVAELAKMGVDAINPSGAPPFMVLGYDNEQALIRKWEQTYKTQIFTSGTSNIDAMRALDVKRFVGVTYFRGDINGIYAKYFVDAGFDCLDMAGIDVDFDKVPQLPSENVYRFIKQAFERNNSAEAIYMLGPAWRTLDIIERLETELGVPVIHAVPVQCWDIQRHLGIREPVKGFGRLIAEMPDGVTISTRRVPDVADTRCS